MPPAFVDPVFLMPYPQPCHVDDYRCAINAKGTGLIFERSQDGGSYLLWYLDLTAQSPQPTPIGPGGMESTRPDWSWKDGFVVCTTPQSLQNTTAPFVSPESVVWVQIDDTKHMSYPVWKPDDTLVVMDNRAAANPHPCSSLINLNGAVWSSPLAGTSVWAGMPSVHPLDPSKLVFAGQLVSNQTKYDQEQNYVWYVDTTDLTTLRPLDKAVKKSDPFRPAYQGRAPWWSPDGKWVAFESNRCSLDGSLYAIYIQDAAGENAAMQVTDPKWNGNHPKWYPGGNQLVASVRQDPKRKPRGMASLAVSAFIG
jgi:hypothetical protein